MNKIDLIIENIEYAKILKESAYQNELLEEALAAAHELKALYTAPPKSEWVGLHLDDIPETFVGDWSFLEGARWAEAKLKEKNT